MNFEKKFWREHTETLLAKVAAVLDKYAAQWKNARDWKSTYLAETALTNLIIELKNMGFSEADALRWAVTRRRKP